MPRGELTEEGQKVINDYNSYRKIKDAVSIKEEDARNHYFSIRWHRIKRRFFWAWFILPIGCSSFLELSQKNLYEAGLGVLIASVVLWFIVAINIGRKYKKYEKNVWIKLDENGNRVD